MKPREEGEESDDEEARAIACRNGSGTRPIGTLDEQKPSGSLHEKRRRDDGQRGSRHDLDKRSRRDEHRRDDHNGRDDHNRRDEPSRRDEHRRDKSSRYDREKDRGRDRDRGTDRESGHDRDHRHRESDRDRDRRDGRAATHRNDKRGETERMRDSNRAERTRLERRPAQHDAGGGKEAPSSHDKHTPRDAERGVAAVAAHAPDSEHKSDEPMNGAEHGALLGKAAPKSLEEVLHRKQEAEQEAAKPKFLSRKEREQAALERNRQRAEAVRRQADAARATLQPHGGASSATRQQGDGNAQQERLSAKEMQEREKQRAIIRQQYLGQQKQKRRIAKASDKFRFNFDWDASEDTHEEKLHEGAILFGRGKLAGIDMRAQCEAAAQKEKLLLSDMRRARGDLTTEADRRADNARAARAAAIDEDPVLKEKHWSEKKREEMTQRDWRIFREDHRISYKNAGKDAPMPYRNWDEMLLPQKLADAVRDLNYTQPSPIQMASAPFGFRQRDVIGLAETGSGKTAAFVLPMLKYIMEQPPMTDALAAEGPYALIMAPTRELAQQIEEETNNLAKYTGFRTACIVGGASYEVQKGKLRKGAEIVVATPGRLLDCLQKRYAVLNQCAYVVLDEADRMIDLGFEPQVIEVLAAMPASNMKPMEGPDDDGTAPENILQEGKQYRTTYMFSATMPIAVERIAKRYLRRPVTVVVGTAGRAVDSVTQRIEWMDRKQKPGALMRALDTFQAEIEHLAASDNDGFKIIVFVNNRENSEDVYNQLAKTGRYNVALLHGGKSQEQREECIGGFRDGEYDVMIATDVAGRGIDVRDVGLVINYDMPHTIENYTHRIGRTGRAGRKGTAVTFLTSADEKTFYDLKNLLEECKVHVPHQLAQHDSAKFKPGQFEQSKKDTTLYAA